MRKHFDSLIIGGGIIGSSIAFQLAKRGYKVAVLEKGKIAGKASGAAAGILGTQTELTEDGPLFRLACKSRSMYQTLIPELEDLSQLHIGCRNNGTYKVAVDQDQESELKRLIERQVGLGEQAEWLTIEELIEREPSVSRELRGAMFIPKDGQLEANELSLAFAKASVTLGAEVFEFTNVIDFILKDGKALGVKTIMGEILADSVIVASGAWSREVLERTGLTLPIIPVKGECFTVIPEKQLIQGTIFSHGCYIVPKRSGRVLVGATVKANSFDERVTVEGLSSLMEKAQTLLPDIGKAEWDRGWAGVRPQSADGQPFLGEHPDYKGLYIATGHFRNGILLAPVTGVLIADLLEGKTDQPNPFGLARLQSSEKGVLL
ncbi:glycine oxidase ThiO [Mesobacillus subterraneus]|uniref:glycine oxidase n=1 Tax=Mesobacillus subterraneus TaxID=285983 RepID=A0A427TVY0_9BACI|nr:glycine oxidase ThiO [Mesobacillus subterraneus]RSD28648.1 glycine oxidase ThiO [Mesobacillus subterraneus]